MFSDHSKSLMLVTAKAPSDTASRVRFALTPAVLGIDLCRSAVPSYPSLAVVRLNRPPSAYWWRNRGFPRFPFCEQLEET